MSTENKIFKMSLDVSDLIANYRRAIQTMSDIGGPTKAITGFEQTLRKLETEFDTLRKKGAEGFPKDPSSVNNYTKAVDKAYKKLETLGIEMEKLGRNTGAFNINGVRDLEREITNLTRQTEQFQRNFSYGLRAIGIDRSVADTIASEVRTQDQLVERLRQELTVRQNILTQARQLQAAEDERQRILAASKASNLINQSTTSSLGLTADAKANITRYLDDTYNNEYITDNVRTLADFIQMLNSKISDGVRRGVQFQEVWREITIDLERASGLNIGQVFGDSESASLRIENIWNEIDRQVNNANTSVLARNTSQAEQNINQLHNVIEQVINSNSNLNQLLNQTAQSEGQLADAESRRINVAQQDAILNQRLSSSINGLANAAGNARNNINKETDSLRGLSGEIKKTEGKISKFANMIGSMFSIYTIFATIRSEIRKTYEDIKTLDKSFASIAMVTDKTVQDMWATYDQYANMASELGQKTNSVIEASALFYQQGLDTNEALALTTDTMKLATLAGESYKTATEEMTSAVRGFRMEMSNGAHVTDVYSTLAASAAASVNDIAQAMARTASIANSAGASFENTSAFLTKMIETTQESAENIGTSLKTIVARFTELKKNPDEISSEFEDLDINKVETALKTVGVQLRDATGQIRDFDKIIVDLGEKWDGLSRNAQRYVATISAGSRQQSRFIALLDDFDRTKELMETAADSTGKADEQFAKYADTMEYKLNRLTTEWEKFKTSIIEEDLFKKSIDSLTNFIKKINEIDLKNPFNIAEIGTGIALMVTGITRSITLMKTMISGTTTFISAIKKDIPQILSNKVKDYYIKKGSQMQVKLEPVIDRNLLNEELNRTRQYLQNLRADRALRVSMIPQMSLTEQTLAEFQVSSTVSQKQRNANYENFLKFAKGTLSTKEIDEFKLQLSLLKTEMEAISGKTVTMGDVFERYRQIVLQDANVTDQQTRELEILEAEIRRVEGEEGRLTGLIEENSNAAERNAGAIERTNAKMSKMEATSLKVQTAVAKFASGGLNLLTAGLSTAMTYLPMIAMGMMDVETGLKTMGIQVGVMIVQQGLLTLANAASAASTKFLAKENEVAKRSYIELMKAELGALAPLYAFLAVAIAIVAAVGIVIYAYKKWADAHDEVRIATEKLKKEEEALKEIQEQRQKIKATKNETKKELEDTIALKKQWEELSLIKNKTTEQQEEENELIEKISSQYPEIITYHDTINNKLDLSISKWEKIIEKQKEATQQAAKEDYLVAVAEATQQYQTKKAELGEKQARNSNLNGDVEKYSLDWEAFNFAKQELGKRKDVYDRYSDIDTGSDIFINYLSDSWGFSEESLELFSKVEGYNLKTKEGVQKFLNGQELTLAEQVGFLKLWKDKVEQANDDIRNYNKELIQAQKDYEETKKIALNEYLSSIEDDVATTLISAKNIERNKKKINYEDFYSNYSDNFTSSSDEKQTILTPGSYGDLTDDGQKALKVFGIDSEEKFKKLDADILTEYIQAAIDVAQNEDLIIKHEELIGKSSYEYLSKIIDGSLDYTQKELRDKISQLKNSEDTIDQSVRFALYDIIQSDFTEINKKIKDIYGKTYGINIEHNTLKNFQLASQGFIDEFEKETVNAVEFLKNLGDFFDKNQVSLEDRTSLINKDLWTSYNPLDEEAFREKVINNFSKSLDKTQEEIEKISDEWIQEGKNANIINENISVGDIEAYSEKVIKIQEAFKDAGEELELFSKQGKKNIIVANDQLETYEKLISSLKEAGIQDTENLLTRDEATGKYIFNLEKANKIMQRYGTNAIDELKNVKEQADIRIAQLKSVENLSEEQAKTLLEQEAISEELEKQIPLIELAIDKAKEYADAFNTAGGRLSSMSSLIKSVSGALSNFQKNKFLGQSDIASLQEGFMPFGIDANQFINKNLGLLNPTSLYQTAISELRKSINSGIFNNEPDKLMQAKGLIAELYNDWIEYLQDVEDEQEKLKEKEEDTEEAKKKVLEQEEKVREKEEENEKERQDALEKIKDAEEDLVKAKQDYVDQLEVIEEKQQAINDAIEKYNELLYGSKNRASSLDIFYNYEQAISSLNDEISRSSDLIGTSNTLNDSIDALSKYTVATHNLIATERAKQLQIQAGLSSYSNMIENGSASYTNRETGELININFGAYARKDTATGKYILDQRLLNQSNFNDEYKNLIEQNIETYNKYVDEYSEIEDEIAKKEKELQDRRTAAVKAYSEIEKNVADALKEQYEQEVEDLKDKYNSMKEADDEYLSALEDAINKQRELRDREDSYEELAEQEKKLSLIQRDTSGSRQLDANKLKKDIEKTRKQLLDEAVNDVVDGLKKLAKENEETRQVEIQLRDAIISNTAHWNGEAQSITSTFTDASDYAGYMANLNPDFSDMTLAQQEVLIEEYKSQFAEALEYQSWNLLDATSETGDAIVDIINVSTDQVLAIASEKTTSFAEEVIRTYNEISEKVQEDLENQEEAIDDARDALQEAIDKLDELSEKIDEAAQKIIDLQEEEEKANAKRIKELEEEKAKIIELQEEVIKKNKEYVQEVQKNQGIPEGVIPDSTSGVETIAENTPNDETPYTGHAQGMEGKTYKEIIENLNEAIKAEANTVRFLPYSNEPANEGRFESIKNQIDELFSVLPISNVGNYIKSYKDKYEAIGRELDLPVVTYMLDRYKKGGLVDFTGPAWVDGTPSAPEAFLSAADTRAIGDAVKILSDLQIIKDYDSLGQSINNTIGDTSIEINLNIENLSSDIDIDNMLNRVKEEIVSVANPVGINAILRQR